MRFLTTCVTASLGFASLFVPAANAFSLQDNFSREDCRLTKSMSSLVCVSRVSDNEWKIGVANNVDGIEVIKAYCSPAGDWKYTSYGDFTKSQVDRIVDDFCKA